MERETADFKTSRDFKHRDFTFAIDFERPQRISNDLTGLQESSWDFKRIHHIS
jgi:hypothetical protein